MIRFRPTGSCSSLWIIQTVNAGCVYPLGDNDCDATSYCLCCCESAYFFFSRRWAKGAAAGDGSPNISTLYDGAAGS